MSVDIAEGKAVIKTIIRVDRPLGATVTADITLGNEKTGANMIVLNGLKVDARADNLVAEFGLGALNVEGQVRKTLANPTQALANYLGKELKKDDVKLEGVGMKFTSDNKLTIALAGRSF